MIKRILEDIIRAKLGKGKAIILIGPRQVGKTTLIKLILQEKEYLFLDGDDPSIRNLLRNVNTEQVKIILGRYKTVFIDEAQRIEEIGITLKIIQDQFKGVQVIVSGSSAFELNNKLNEPLTGRKWEYQMFPISWKELETNVGYVNAEQQLELRIIYGMYPAVINHPDDAFEELKQLTNSYLYKDILSFSGIRKPAVVEKLLQALALQIGNEVSFNELSQLLGVDKNTIATYIEILEQAFVIFRLKSFSRNLRNEIKSNQKIYFYDTGVRNLIIGNLNSLELRKDTGALWENFIISERKKKNQYSGAIINSYFWRTVQQQEIDYVEEIAQEIKGYEIKWNPKAKTKLPKSFSEAYDAKIEVLNRENYLSFLL